MKKTWCYLWSYDNFTFEYEESEQDFDTLQECIQAMWKDRKANLELMHAPSIMEPKCYYMFRKKEDDGETVWCSDYTWTRRGNKIFLHRKDIL